MRTRLRLVRARADDRTFHRPWRQDTRDGLAVYFGENGAEDLVTGDDSVERLAKAVDLDRAEVEFPGALVRLGIAFKALEKPNSLLRERERAIGTCTRRGCH